MSLNISAVGLPAAPGGLRAAGRILRAAVYVDGFNLYHAIDDLGLPHLKWVDLFALSRRLIRSGEELKRVVWCTAVNRKNHLKMLRWREYKKALIASGVVCMEGHFAEEPRKCPDGHSYFQPTEKEGDVHLAICLISDGHLDEYDTAYLVTADSDQVATVKVFRERLPHKEIISVAPPGRSHSKAIIEHSHATRSIKKETIEASLLGGPAIIRDGTLIARRPDQYAPPEGWSPPGAIAGST